MDCDGGYAGILRARDTRGGVELHFAPARQHQVDRVENRRLARTVVAQEEQMPAFGDFNGRRPEVVKLHHTDGRDAVCLARFHDVDSSPIGWASWAA